MIFNFFDPTNKNGVCRVHDTDCSSVNVKISCYVCKTAYQVAPYDEASWVNTGSFNGIFLGDIITVNYHSGDHSPTSMCAHELFCLLRYGS